jgi:hypothetical protein
MAENRKKTNVFWRFQAKTKETLGKTVFSCGNRSFSVDLVRPEAAL